jgi:lysophospholipase L1-like esterase
MACKGCRKVLRWTLVRLLFGSLVLALLLGMLYVAESGFALTDPQRGLPPQTVRVKGTRYSWGVPIHNNRIGFRSRELAPKKEGVFRIMVLGDSMTWGAGLPVSQRYSDILEQRLNRQFGAGRCEVHNFAVSGGPMILHTRVLYNYLQAVDPDLIIVGFCYNDTETILKGAPSPEKRRFDRRYGPALQQMTSFLAGVGLPHIGVRTENTIRRTAELCHVYPDSLTALDRTYDPNSKEWKTFVRAVRTIKEASDARGLPAPIFASLNHGVYFNKPTDYVHPDRLVATFLRWHHQAQAVAQEYGYTVVDFHEEIARRLQGRSLVLNRLDNHPSAALNRLYADKLYPLVCAVIWRDPEFVHQRR